MSSEREAFVQKFAARISYLGTRYCGWQKQKGSAAEGAPSIQQTFEEVLQSIVSEPVSVVASGRTDAGVHASGQVVHFILRGRPSRGEWTTEVLRRALNSRLPPSIRVLKVQGVPLDFNAQRSAIKKQYSYYFQQGAAPHAPVEPLSWFIHRSLDREAMAVALRDLLGEHDFLPFQARGAQVRTTVRTILEAELSWVPLPVGVPGGWVLPGHAGEFGFVRIRLVGTGFLKQMVRGIAGTLLEIGEGRRSADSIRHILETQNRSLVGRTAAAQGLWLEQVWYDEFS